MSKGSTWSIWDFHLHTPYSVLNNQFGDPDKSETWERYVSEIERKSTEHRIAAIGITDYFTIEGYTRLKSFQEKGRLANIFLFPNIEFRVDKLFYRSKSGEDPHRLNLHILFSPEVADQIKDRFLSRLEFDFEANPFGSTLRRSLTTENLTAYGELLKTQHTSFSDSAIKIGY